MLVHGDDGDNNGNDDQDDVDNSGGDGISDPSTSKNAETCLCYHRNICCVH